MTDAGGSTAEAESPHSDACSSSDGNNAAAVELQATPAHASSSSPPAEPATPGEDDAKRCLHQHQMEETQSEAQLRPSGSESEVGGERDDAGSVSTDEENEAVGNGEACESDDDDDEERRMCKCCKCSCLMWGKPYQRGSYVTTILGPVWTHDCVEFVIKHWFPKGCNCDNILKIVFLPLTLLCLIPALIFGVLGDMLNLPVWLLTIGYCLPCRRYGTLCFYRRKHLEIDRHPVFVLLLIAELVL
ncbi:hypothetical protein Pelo_12453 [Pelomyxa schiedti]|nr:hypothetical protein Pelo_12453 [Pelomyxa schiedti]